MLGNGADIGLPVVHGLSGNRLTLVNNGVVHTGQQWGADHSPEIDLNSASEVSVVSGAAAMRYPGTHMGGIVILESGPFLLTRTFMEKSAPPLKAMVVVEPLTDSCIRA